MSTIFSPLFEKLTSPKESFREGGDREEIRKR
jgi:hypothetical protein